MKDLQITHHSGLKSLNFKVATSILMTEMRGKYLGVLFHVVYNILFRDCTFHVDKKFKFVSHQ